MEHCRRLHNFILDKLRPPREIQYKYTICVMGHPNVGKTSLISRLLYGSFPKDGPYLEEEIIHQRCHEDEVLLEIVDFSTTEDCDIRRGDAFILVYDSQDPATFGFLRTLFHHINAIKKKQVGFVPKILVVANKLDLQQNDHDLCADKLTVDTEWNVPFISTSAKNSTNITELYKIICQYLIIRGRCSTAGKELVHTQGLVGFTSPGSVFRNTKVRIVPREKSYIYKDSFEWQDTGSRRRTFSMVSTRPSAGRSRSQNTKDGLSLTLSERSSAATRRANSLF